MSYGLTPVGCFAIGFVGAPTRTGIALDSALVMGTSGDAILSSFCAPVSQTNGSLTVYVHTNGSPVGSPTDVRCALWGQHASDDDRPDTTSAALYTSAAADFTGKTDAWVALTFTGVSLTAGTTYWLAVYNNTATPASNYPTIDYRGGYGGSSADRIFQCSYTTDGCATDPTTNSGVIPWVIKFDDGTLFGSSWTQQDTGANNTNWRGNRYRFNADVKLLGVAWSGSASAYSGGLLRVYNGATQVASVTLDVRQAIQTNFVMFAGPLTLTRDTDYDIVIQPVSNTTAGARHYTGEATATCPADVKACVGLTGSTYCQHVSGATPGAFAVDDVRQSVMVLFVHDLVAPAAGGSSPIIIS